MLYGEFITITGYDENYITWIDYNDYIEPIYDSSNQDKHKWCKAFCKAHDRCVNTPVNMAISAHTTDEKMAYISGSPEVMDDVKELHNTLKDTFLKALRSKIFVTENKLGRV